MSEKQLFIDVNNVRPPTPPLKINTIDMVFILTELFADDEKMKTLLQLDIDSEGVDFIRILLEKSPEVLKDISKDINEILRDGILNTDDVPILVNLIKNVMNLNVKNIQKELLKIDKVLSFLKALLEILIIEGYIKVVNKEKVFNLIDVSFLLLSSTIDQDTNLLDCFKRYFKC
jgi:hypothetical protein